MMSIAALRGRINKYPKYVLALGLSWLIIVVIAGVLIYNHSHTPKKLNQSRPRTEMQLANDAFLKGDKAQALAHAKQALAQDPNNVDNILLVANLTKAENPSAAHQYYVQALNVFKQQDNPDVPGKTAVTYWAAAGLAQQAGETAQARNYYQQVIQAAKPSDSYEQSLATQSRAALAGLQ